MNYISYRLSDDTSLSNINNKHLEDNPQPNAIHWHNDYPYMRSISALFLINTDLM
ncbi:MAG: hypothetical protein PHW00_04835 [Clostridia bacterium]|nr:hypothetical protein [Clostridia bacterium]